MVVLGVRTEGESQIFMLQNWWRDKQFVEVSEDYMTMDCSICFIGTPQTFANDRLPSHAEELKFVDSDMMDCRDCLMDDQEYGADD